MKYWKLLDKDGCICSIESHSNDHKVPNGIEISKEEYDNYLASLPKEAPQSIRNLFAEIDDIKVRLEALETKTQSLH